MTDTDRIAALEREVAELRSEFRQLLGLATFGTFSLPMKDTAAPAPIPNEYRVLTCPACGVRMLSGSWHICSPVYTNTGGTS